MTGALRKGALTLVIGLLGVLAGCATPPRAPTSPVDGAPASWSGRMALTVPGPAGTPDPGQSFSAAFQLQGGPKAGELTLISPIGSTLALLRWRPGSAELQAEGRTRQYESLDALVAGATGTPVPVAALFDWLQGRDSPVPGWHADLSRQPEGRIAAHRDAPPPEADLRVVLDR